MSITWLDAQEVNFEWGEEYDKKGNSSAWYFYHVNSDEDGHKYLHFFNNYLWLYSFDADLNYQKVDVLEKFKFTDFIVQSETTERIVSLNDKIYAVISSYNKDKTFIEEYLHLVEIDDNGVYGEKLELFNTRIEGSNGVGSFIVDLSPDQSKLLMIYKNVNNEEGLGNKLIVKTFDSSLAEIWSNTESIDGKFSFQIRRETRYKTKQGYFISNKGEVSISLIEFVKESISKGKSVNKESQIFAYSEGGEQILNVIKEFDKDLSWFEVMVQEDKVLGVSLEIEEIKSQDDLQICSLHVFENGNQKAIELNLNELVSGKRKKYKAGFDWVRFENVGDNLLIVMEEVFYSYSSGTTLMNFRDLVVLAIDKNDNLLGSEYVSKFQTSAGSNEKWRNSSYLLLNNGEDASIIYEAIGNDKDVIAGKDENGMTYQVVLNGENSSIINKNVLFDTKDKDLYLRPTTLKKLDGNTYLIMSESKTKARLGKIILN